MADYIYPSAGANPLLTEKVLRTDDIITQALADLRGVKKQKVGNKWEWVKYSDPLMNKQGLAVVESWMRSLLNRNTFLSALHNELSADNILRSNLDDLTVQLALNYHEYDIDLIKLDHIISLIANYTQFAVYRSVISGHSDKDFLQKSVSEKHESHEVAEKQQKAGGILGIFSR